MSAPKLENASFQTKRPSHKKKASRARDRGRRARERRQLFVGRFPGEEACAGGAGGAPNGGRGRRRRRGRIWRRRAHATNHPAAPGAAAQNRVRRFLLIRHYCLLVDGGCVVICGPRAPFLCPARREHNLVRRRRRRRQYSWHDFRAGNSLHPFPPLSLSLALIE
jgi:hypothetical protein